MELQNVLGELERRGVTPFAISYDSVRTLGDFAARQGITYPLLSDAGSRVIRALGMANDRLEARAAAVGLPHPERYRGVSYPGVFLLDERGVVRERRFHQDDHVRDTGPGLLEDLLGVALPLPARAVQSGDEVARASAFLDSPAYTNFQRLQLIVQLDIAPGYHVYAAPAPEGVMALALELSLPGGVTAGTPRWPAPHVLETAAGERVAVHEGSVRGRVPLVFGRATADVVVRAALSFQACDARTCFVPSRFAVELPVSRKPVV